MVLDEFYRQAAIAAMQGLQESGLKSLEIAFDDLPKELAKRSFDIADAMVAEYLERKDKTERKKMPTFPPEYNGIIC